MSKAIADLMAEKGRAISELRSLPSGAKAGLSKGLKVKNTDSKGRRAL